MRHYNIDAEHYVHIVQILIKNKIKKIISFYFLLPCLFCWRLLNWLFRIPSCAARLVMSFRANGDCPATKSGSNTSMCCCFFLAALCCGRGWSSTRTGLLACLPPLGNGNWCCFKKNHSSLNGWIYKQKKRQNEAQ